LPYFHLSVEGTSLPNRYWKEEKEGKLLSSLTIFLFSKGEKKIRIHLHKKTQKKKKGGGGGGGDVSFGGRGRETS